MDDNLCKYELDRLARMKENKQTLRELGIEPLVPKEETKRKKRKSSAQKSEVALPQRHQPPRGNGKRKDYTDAEFFAQHNLILDGIDEDDKLRRRKVQKIRHPCQRVLKHPHRFHDLEFTNRSKKASQPMHQGTNTLADSIGHLAADTGHTLGHGTSDIPEFQHYHAFVTNSMNAERLQKLFFFRFTTSHIRESGGTQELIDTFQHLCDCNAHIRYLDTMNEGRSQSSWFHPGDVCAVAQAITANADLSTFDAEIVARYNTAVAHFKGHPCKLDLNVKTSTNPLLICRLCNGSYASKKNGDMRDHVCIS